MILATKRFFSYMACGSFCFIIAILINFALRPILPSMDRGLRDIVHLIAAYGVPLLVLSAIRLIFDVVVCFASKRNINFPKNFFICVSIIIYSIFEFYHEYSQYLQKRYLQWDQYLFEVIGFIILLISYKKLDYYLENKILKSF